MFNLQYEVYMYVIYYASWYIATINCFVFNFQKHMCYSMLIILSWYVNYLILRLWYTIE